MEILDCFCGIGGWATRDPILPYSPDDILRQMDRFAISRALTFSNGIKFALSAAEANHDVVEKTRGSSRLIPAFAIAIHPYDTCPDVKAYFGLMKEAGVRGLWLNIPFTGCDGVAKTGQEWVLRLRFRVPRRTFKPLLLAEQLKLVPFSEAAPVVPSEARRLEVVELPRNLGQEITITVHAAADVQTEGFTRFLDAAVRAVGGPGEADAWADAKRRLKETVRDKPR